jgi:ArsR family transcriptional regulator
MKNIQGTVFDCFSSEKRVRLILCLKDEKCVSDLLTLCDLSQSALSQHLKILKDGGVVTCRRDGKKQMYKTVSKKALTLAQDLLVLQEA